MIPSLNDAFYSVAYLINEWNLMYTLIDLLFEIVLVCMLYILNVN